MELRGALTVRKGWTNPGSPAYWRGDEFTQFRLGNAVGVLGHSGWFHDFVYPAVSAFAVGHSPQNGRLHLNVGKLLGRAEVSA